MINESLMQLIRERRSNAQNGYNSTKLEIFMPKYSQIRGETESSLKLRSGSDVLPENLIRNTLLTNPELHL